MVLYLISSTVGSEETVVILSSFVTSVLIITETCSDVFGEVKSFGNSMSGDVIVESPLIGTLTTFESLAA